MIRNRPALFLDRDGVINFDTGYVHRPADFHFIPGIFDVVKVASSLGYWIVVVTNQAGIGRGYYSEHQFHVLTEWMRCRFLEHGGRIDAVYFCPYHPIFGIGEYLRQSDFRKPAPGMLLQAQRDLGIEMGQSVLVGDNQTDMAAGRAAGVGTLLLLRGSDQGNDVVAINQLHDVLEHLKFCQTS